MSMPPYVVANGGGLVAKDNVFVGQLLVDDFERGDLAPYSATGGFSINSVRASQGTYSLRGDGGSGPKSIVSRPGDGLPYYPSRGDTIKVDVQFDTLPTGPTDGADYDIFGFFHGSGTIEEDDYEVQMSGGNGTISLVNDTGNDKFLDTAACSYRTDAWDTLTIDTDSSGITVDFRDAHLSTANTTRSSGGILFFTNGNRVFFDNVRAI